MEEASDSSHVQSRTVRFGRREFLGAASALAASSSIAAKALAETPQRGGHLVVGLSSASSGDTLSPARLGSEYLECTVLQFYDSLTMIDEHAKVHPALATGWEAKPGAKEWVLKLRRGVTFHNGKELTAPDVVYTINFHRNADTKSTARALVAAIADIKATAKYEVSITLGDGNADLPYLLADDHLGIGPEGSDFLGGVGTGAFVLDSFQPGVTVRAKRNPNDWRKDRGYVDSTECIGINDTTARLSALLSGSVHLINRIDLNGVASLSTNSQVQVFNTPSAGFSEYPMRSDQVPYESLDLRLAMKYAIDREQIVKTVLRGNGRVGNDQPIPWFDPFFAADIPQRSYDPDKARFYYKRSGHNGPLVIPVADISFNGAIEVTELFQASAAKAGMDIQIDRRPSNGYFDQYWLKAPIMGTNLGGRPTADLMLTLGWLSNAPWNEAHWQRPKFDQLLIAARTELDQKKRKQMYHDMQQMVYEDGGSLIPMFSNYIDGGTKNVRGFVPSPVRQMSNYRAPEKVWLTS